MMKRKEAYFTVEAALLLPFATGVLILAVFLFIFQYDRCLLEQDMGLLVLYAATVQADDAKEAASLVRRRTSELSKEKYIAWETEELQITWKQNEIRIDGAGKLIFPLREWNFRKGDNEWRVAASRRSMQLSPADFIRNYRRIQEEIADAD